MKFPWGSLEWLEKGRQEATKTGIKRNRLKTKFSRVEQLLRKLTLEAQNGVCLMKVELQHLSTVVLRTARLVRHIVMVRNTQEYGRKVLMRGMECTDSQTSIV